MTERQPPTAPNPNAQNPAARDPVAQAPAAAVPAARAAACHRAAVFAAALWLGGMTAIGFMAVPMLFALMPDKALAGRMAGRLFAAQEWWVLACGVTLLLCSRAGGGLPAPWRMLPAGAPPRRALVAGDALVLLGMLLALLQQNLVSPRIQARIDPAFWHTLGTGMVVVQWLCAAWLLWRLSARCDLHAGSGGTP